MGNIEVKQEIGVHNKFEVKVLDAETKQLKDEAVGYNLIIDYFFYYLYTYYCDISLSSRIFKPNIYFATASTSQDISEYDYGIYNCLGYKTPTLYERVIAENYNTPSHVTYYIILAASEYNGETISEVGFYSGTSLTKSILKDINGNPHPIQKTSSDIVYIYATLYAYANNTSTSTINIFPPSPNYNHFVRVLLGLTSLGYEYYFYISSINKDICNNDYSFSIPDTMYYTRNTDFYNDTITFTKYLSENAYLNNTLMRNIFSYGCGGTTFPNSTIYPGTEITEESIGTGDGTTTEFKVKVPVYKSGTLKVYKNGTQLTSGTDYTEDNEANSNGLYGVFPSLALHWEKSPAEVKIGNAPDYGDGTYTTTTGYEPFSFDGAPGDGSGYYTINVPNGDYTINSTYPIWIDFGSAKECNTLRYLTNTDVSSYTLILEYSSDNSTWTRLTTTYSTPNYTYTFAKTSARYWRWYYDSQDITMNFKYNGGSYTTETFDGKNKSFFPRFLLGKIAPAITFTTAPAVGDILTVDYTMDIPFKYDHNTFTYTQNIGLTRYSNPPAATDLGGRIIYIDETSTGATYVFKDASGNVLSNVAVGDRPASVEITGTPDKPKYYIYGDQFIGKGIIYFLPTTDSASTTLLNTSTTFGTGLSNTLLLLNGSSIGDRDYFIYRLKKIRNKRPYRGYNDWYIPSSEELKLFIVQKDSDDNYIIETTEFIYSSSEYDSSHIKIIRRSGSSIIESYSSKGGTSTSCAWYYTLIRSF